MQLCCIIAFWSAIAAQPKKKLWVLQKPDLIVEYDMGDFSQKRVVTIPSDVFQAPERFAVNQRGQMLFHSRPFLNGVDTSRRSPDTKIWFWNGEETKIIEPSRRRTVKPAGGTKETETILLEILISANDNLLFGFEKKYRTDHHLLKDGRRGPEAQIQTSYRVFTMNVDDYTRSEIAAFAFPPCECLTGACLETCPDGEIWAPKGGIENFFFITHLIHGQLSAEYQDSFLFVPSGETWAKTRLDVPVERFLDAAKDGDPFVSAVSDAGCCGWDNESNDQTMIVREGSSIVLFDERESYRNPDYDVSFFTANAKLSPRGSLIAMTLGTSARNLSEIRLSSDGSTDEEELRRIRETIQSLPEVVVLKAIEPPEQLTAIPNADFIDWISEEEILLIEEGSPAVYSVNTRTRRKSQIKASDVTYVFVR